MILPIDFPEANYKYVLNNADQQKAGEFHDSTLPVFRNGEETISCWDVTDEDLEMIKNTRQIWLRIVGPHQPPCQVTADSPFHTAAEFDTTIEETSHEMSDDTPGNRE